MLSTGSSGNMFIETFEAAQSPVLEEMQPTIIRVMDAEGIALLRGFDVGVSRFEALTHSMCHKFHNTGSRYTNRETKGDTFSTYVMPKNYTLFAHGEGVYSPRPGGRPEIAYFLCLTPPSETGGETILIDGIEFLENLPAAWRKRFESGLVYEMLWEKDRWMAEFGVEDAGELEAVLARSPNIRYTLDGDRLHLFYTTQAITRSRNGHSVFAPGMLPHLPRVTHPRYQGKNVHTKPTNRVHFGDGDEITNEIANGLIDIHDDLAYPHVWQKDEILVLDNTRYMHGRTMTARDCERVIISRFGWLK